jgi:hypothetical protein
MHAPHYPRSLGSISRRNHLIQHARWQDYFKMSGRGMLPAATPRTVVGRRTLYNVEVHESGMGVRRAMFFEASYPDLERLPCANPVWKRSRSNHFEVVPSAVIVGIPGIDGTRGFEKQHLGFFSSYGSMLDAARHNDGIPLPEFNVTIPELHGKSTMKDKKKFVLMLMPVPDKFPFEFCKLDVLSIQFADDTRIPVIRYQVQLFLKIECFHCCSFS